MNLVWKRVPGKFRLDEMDDGRWDREARNGMLATYDHPTPQSLALSAGCGGFANGEDRQCYAQLAVWLLVTSGWRRELERNPVATQRESRYDSGRSTGFVVEVASYENPSNPAGFLVGDVSHVAENLADGLATGWLERGPRAGPEAPGCAHADHSAARPTFSPPPAMPWQGSAQALLAMAPLPGVSRVHAAFRVVLSVFQRCVGCVTFGAPEFPWLPAVHLGIMT